MKAYSAITLLPGTRSEMDRMSRSVIESVQNGEVSPIKILVQLRAFERVIEAIMEGIKENVMTEADGYEKKFEIFGNEIEKGEFGVSYDYSVCGDPTFERLEVDANAAKESLDARKKFLRALTEPTPMVDTVTGELVTVRPPLKKSTSGLKVKFL